MKNAGEATNKKILDTGEFLPFAKKHLAEGQESSGKITLSDLWHEPDWTQMCIDGLDIEVCVYLAIYYKSWRKKPRAGGRSVSSEQWYKAYIDSIDILKCLFENVQDISDVEELPVLFRSAVGVPKTSGKKHIRDVYRLYALGTGENRTYRTPFSLTPRQKNLIKLLPKIGWPFSVKPSEIQLFPIEFSSAEGHYFRLCNIQGNNFTWTDNEADKNHYLNEGEAINALLEQLQLPMSPFIPKKKRDEVRHVNLDRNISPEEFLNCFKFRGVQFGNWLSDRDRQLFLNNSYYAFKVLAHLLNIPCGWIGLGGKLGIAFGARGQGFASAHYEPELNIINLTKRNGPGAVAHEWFHALDALLAASTGSNNRLLSEMIWEVELHNKPDNYMNSINLIVDLLENEFAESSFQKRSHELESQKGAPKYWTTDSEMLARSFEAFVEDWLLENNVICDWLVIGTKESDTPREYLNKHPYPLNSERVSINAKISHLMNVIWQKSTG